MYIIECTTNCKDEYICKYGRHFNEKLFNFAVSKITKNGTSLTPITKEQVDSLLTTYNIVLNNSVGWDYVYVANVGKAYFLNSSIIDEAHLVKYIKDVLDNENSYEGVVFDRWKNMMKHKDIKVEWKEMI